MPGPAMQHQDRLPGASLRDVEGHRALGDGDLDKAMRDPRQRGDGCVVGTGRSHGTHPRLSHTLTGPSLIDPSWLGAVSATRATFPGW